jgi:hypothetical protein
MKLRTPSAFTAIIALLLSASVGSAQEVQRSAPTTATKVETRTYDQDGKKVTERVLTTTVKEVETVSKPDAYRTAIFVSNRTGRVHDDKVLALEDYITARVTDQGLTVISRETALNAVGKLDPGAADNELDAKLADNTSAVRLAQTLGADYLLQVTLTGFDAKQHNVAAYGVKATNDERTVRVSYKILDGATGGSLAADTVKVSKVIQQSGTAAEDHSDVLNELLDEASLKVATSLKAKLKRRPLAASAEQSLVSVTITTEAADLMIPDVRISGENTVTISESKFKVIPLAVNVEVDGISVGSAPGTVQVKRGLSKLRVTREGFKPWERTVNFANGQSLNVALTMSDAGYARWKDSTAFINELKNGAKLTDGEVKVLEGKAQMLKQSGIKVDTKEGIKIDSRSLLGN